MFKFNRTFFVINNSIISFVIFILIYKLRYSLITFIGIEKRILPVQTIVLFLTYSLIITIFNISLKTYELNKINTITESLLSGFIASIFSMSIFGLYFYFTQTNFARFVFITGFLSIPVFISIFNKMLFHILNNRKNPFKVLYIGSLKNFYLLNKLFEDYNKWLQIDLSKIFINNSTNNLKLKFQKYELVILDTDQKFNESILKSLNDFEIRGGRIYSLVDTFSFFDQSLPIEIISNSFYNFFSYYKLESYYNKHFKRLIDIFLSLILILIFSPLFLLTMLLIKIFSKGNIFFLQKRSTLNNKEFLIFKFRTMETLQKGKRLFTEKNDSRLTTIGKILRKLRIDELPQLLNVLIGDISLIGPRPERPELIQKIIVKYPLFNKRLLIKPGLTGWAQVKYSYVNKIEDMNKKLSYDLYYLKNISFIFDIKILLYTLETIIFRRGAV